MPRRLRVAFRRPDAPGARTLLDASAGPTEVDFVAYGEDCVLSGRTHLDQSRLSDMLNGNDEIDLVGIMVERFDGGPRMRVAEVIVPCTELWLVHASGPRGDVMRRKRTAQQYVAVQMGPYEVRGFYHALPGTDPASAIMRRKPMVPLTDARIGYTINGQRRDIRVDTVIVNRAHIEWLENVEPDRTEFPIRQRPVTPQQT